VPSASAIRLGTRGSQLAIWQANTVATRIAETGGPPCRIVVIKTSGDRLQDAPLSEIGGKSLFVKEIEDALLKHEIDIAVHSSKDMPALLPDGLALGAVLPREDPRDAVVLPARAVVSLEGAGSRGRRADEYSVTGVEDLDDLIRVLGQTPFIGTASVRRVAQLMRLFRGAHFGAIRGNLDTRLRKLDAGDPGSNYDALVLAAAGLRRLGFASRISFALPAEACVPAPGQGIVAIEIRADATEIANVVARINDMEASASLMAERAVVNALGGGCQTPIGALASPMDGGAGREAAIDLVATVIALDGSRVVRARARGPQSEAAAIGARVAVQLLEEGAAEILADARIKANALEDTQH
jgi:hydroxymethylbilane synthase